MPSGRERLELNTLTRFLIAKPIPLWPEAL
jgi:hypothetical protein